MTAPAPDPELVLIPPTQQEKPDDAHPQEEEEGNPQEDLPALREPRPLRGFKDAELLRKYQTEKGKILPRRITGNCLDHQKMMGSAIKRARILSLVL